MIGSEVLRIAAEVRAAQTASRTMCNLTVGDFDPREIPLGVVAPQLAQMVGE